MRLPILRSLLIGLALSAGPTDAPTQPPKITLGLHTTMDAAGPGTAIATWIFFMDKGPHSDRLLAEAEARLTPRARARRLRNRGIDNLVDWHDIPVFEPYVEGIGPHVGRIRHRSRWLNTVSVEATPAQLEQVANMSFVRRLDVVRGSTPPVPISDESRQPFTSPNTKTSHTAHDYGASFTQNDLINVTSLHDIGYSGRGVLVCMLDSGFNNLGHDAFALLRIHATWDFVNGDSIVWDEDGQMGTGDHGTITLSVIAGFEPGQLIGPAWGATYMLGKTENTVWERHIEEDHWVAGAEWADTEGADIINSSLGYLDGFTNGEASYTWHDMDGNTAIVTRGADIAASRGILVVNSAGNEGLAIPPANTLIAPGDGDSVLCVGAVTASGTRATFSSMGPTADGRTKPDVMAMGAVVRAASAAGSAAYLSTSGTSLSSPLVAGAAALMLEANPTLSVVDIVDALRSTASNASSPNNFMGWGIIDAAAAWQTTITAVPDLTSSSLRLYPASPNPFNPSTMLRFELPHASRVELRVFDIAGREVATLVAGHRPAGLNSVAWDGTNNAGVPVSTGLYFYELRTKGARLSHKMVLLK
jgi:hypothetical protein